MRFQSSRLAIEGFMAAALFLQATAGAQAVTTTDAVRHFRLGVECTNEERYDQAADEFEAAYRLSHDYRYLFNLAQVQAWRWKALEAVQAFERYLEEGGARIPAGRRRLVEQELVRQRGRLAWLDLQVQPAGTEVEIDGKSQGKSPFQKPLPVTGGEHVISASADGYVRETRAVKVTVDEHHRIQFELARAPLPPPPMRLGQLEIRCSVPAVRVSMDGRAVGTTPFAAPLLGQVGEHRVQFTRAGYESEHATARIEESRLTTLECHLATPASPFPALSGRLQFSISETGAEIFVDGARAERDLTLPLGVHTLEVTRYGFVTWRREVKVTAGLRRVDVTLSPTESYRRDYEAEAHAQRYRAYALGAVGITGAVVASGLAIWNQGRYADWQREHAALEAAYGRQPPYPSDLDRRRVAVNEMLNAVHSADVAVAVVGVASALLLAGGAVLYFGGEDPYRYSRFSRPSNVGFTPAGIRLGW